MIKITFHYRYRKQILIGVSILIILIATISLGIIYYPKLFKEKKNDIISGKTQSTLKKENTTNKELTNLFKVDIKGQIKNPGIYTLEESSRVIDVIEKAGGLTEQANTTVINLSKKISDEMVIIIYSNDEVKDFAKTKEIEDQIQQQCIQKDESSLKNDACICSENIKTQIKVSINNATVEVLTTLSGIGEGKAKDIINYRTENGPFKKIEDLMNVPGIGENLFAKIKENITL